VTVYQQNPVLLAVIASIEAIPAEVGDGEKPDGAGWQGAPNNSTFVGYSVVHPFRNSFDGSIDDPFDDGSPTISVASYGANRAQATMLADRIHTRLVTVPLAITGRHVMIVVPLEDSAVDRVGEGSSPTQPPMWQDVRRYRIDTTAP
jgi:hypothetical protein